MISFNCQGCGYKYQVPDKYAGKKARCKECDEIFIVPILNDDKHQMQLKQSGSVPNNSTEQTLENNQIHQQSSASTIPIWTWCILGLLGVSFVSFLLYMFAFKDTWEVDHCREISQIIREARSFVEDNDYKSGVVKYSELNHLIGNRELKDKNLKQEVTIALNDYETLKKIILKEKKRQAELARLEEQRKLEEKRRAEERQQQILAERKRILAKEERQRVAKAKALMYWFSVNWTNPLYG